MPSNNPYGKSNKVNLRVDDFDKLLWDQGIKIKHEKATKCPNCFDIESGHYDINCTLCQNGHMFFDEREMWAMMYQKKMEEMFQVQGVWEMGDALMTFPALYPDDKSVVRIDYYDRITILDFAERTSDLVKRGSVGDTDYIRYDVVDVLKLSTSDKEYFKDTDFVIENTNIKWITTNRPLGGDIYTLAYTYKPVYLVVNFFHESRYYYDSWKKSERVPRYLPIQAQVRRDYIRDERKGYN